MWTVVWIYCSKKYDLKKKLFEIFGERQVAVFFPVLWCVLFVISWATTESKNTERIQFHSPLWSFVDDAGRSRTWLNFKTNKTFVLRIERICSIAASSVHSSNNLVREWGEERFARTATRLSSKLNKSPEQTVLEKSHKSTNDRKLSSQSGNRIMHSLNSFPSSS